MNETQETVFNFIQAYIEKYGWSPERRVIANGTDINEETVKKAIAHLLNIGLIKHVKKHEIRVIDLSTAPSVLYPR